MPDFKRSIPFRPSGVTFAGLPGLPFFAGVSILLILTLAGASLVSSQERSGYYYQVQSIEAEDLGITNPVGLAFSPAAGLFYILERQATESGAESGSKIVASNPFGDPAGTDSRAEFIPDPLNVAFAGSTNSLYFLEATERGVVRVEAGQSGRLEEPQGRLSRFASWPAGLLDPQGMAYDAGRERLYFLDAAGPAIIGIATGPAEGSAGPAGDGGSEPARISIDLPADVALRGVAYNPADGHFYVLGVEKRILYELDEGGRALSMRDLSETGLREPQGMVFAPSADPTDDPGNMDLFIADSGGQGEAASPGQIVELSFRKPIAAPAAEELPVTLVQVIDTSKKAWNPSSPDPAGMAYIPGIDRLIISDSEVEENHPDFRGKNVFISTRRGELTDTCDTLAFSIEPTGVGFNPNNGHIFFSDDDKNRIFEVDPVDGVYCNADDIVTHLSVGALAIEDAEGVTFGENKLFITDGLGAEVYIVNLGPDGAVGGGDDVLTDHFDTLALGLRDPSGIEYNPERKTLFIVSTYGGDFNLMETTKAGNPVYRYDLYSLGNMRRSGLALAPNSRDEAVKSLYMTNRGEDNDDNPNENDGQIYELLLGQPHPEPTPTPKPQSQSIYLPVIRGD